MDITGPAGERIVYAGDMGPSEEVIDLARGAEVLILEATLEDGATDDARRGHLDTPEAIDHVAGRASSRACSSTTGRNGATSSASCAPRRACRSSPGVTGMVVDIEQGSVRVDAPAMPAWVPPADPAPGGPGAGCAGAAERCLD